MSVLHQLRELMPARAVSDQEARGLAERQAARLLRLSGITEPHVPGSIIAELPRVSVEMRSGLPASGATNWDRTTKVWRIRLRSQDAAVRQRFSLAHELKHVIDHPFIERAYPQVGRRTERQRAEQVCDYFAACLLMPRPWVKKAWASGTQEIEALAELFGVSTQAMTYRLVDLGLLPSTRHNLYFRSLPKIDDGMDGVFAYFRPAPTYPLELVA
jgi:predicted transcriptional regulator